MVHKVPESKKASVNGSSRTVDIENIYIKLSYNAYLVSCSLFLYCMLASFASYRQQKSNLPNLIWKY